MKPRLPRLLLRVVTTLLLGCAVAAAPDGAERHGWKLTFDDEFDGNALDATKWNPCDPWGRERNRELQAYVSDSFEVTNGILRVKAEKRAAFYAGRRRSYTSGMMTTYGKFSQRYGRFEIRCRVPKGRGMWPAFWLLPDPLGWPPEIDIVEILGHETDKVYMTHHFHDAAKKHSSEGGSWTGPDFSKDFHVFSVEWSPKRIQWFVDGLQRFSADKSIPENKMYMLLNLAVGGDWPGAPDEKTELPAAFEVDYVRAYERELQ